jgi:hypothetical protein
MLEISVFQKANSQVIHWKALFIIHISDMLRIYKEFPKMNKKIDATQLHKDKILERVPHKRG